MKHDFKKEKEKLQLFPNKLLATPDRTTMNDISKDVKKCFVSFYKYLTTYVIARCMID